MEEKDVYEEITNVFTAKSAKEMLYYLYAVSRVYDGREVKRDAYKPAIEWLFGESHDFAETREKYHLLRSRVGRHRPLTLGILEGELKPAYEEVQESFREVCASLSRRKCESEG